ncbi:hypothetical protein CAOG_04589 [Capsaspora owczarzaki ATCC 30864]|uniref:hypothetical protein n=1 Tax=Capsaspora owczarzaki (strain ATCC 30864) TaxID=595528 RepID=UPI0003521240|nr:hypothetical protein CAOG_04589 [Capsaspora owczarzaki ATCC 30864]|eukprot:XP_004347336.2 hypothetical protein CAOG_04589 [Capsaspora owczarzaki ATCC 30864]
MSKERRKDESSSDSDDSEDDEQRLRFAEAAVTASVLKTPSHRADRSGAMGASGSVTGGASNSRNGTLDNTQCIDIDRPKHDIHVRLHPAEMQFRSAAIATATQLRLLLPSGAGAAPQPVSLRSEVYDQDSYNPGRMWAQNDKEFHKHAYTRLSKMLDETCGAAITPNLWEKTLPWLKDRKAAASPKDQSSDSMKFISGLPGAPSLTVLPYSSLSSSLKPVPTPDPARASVKRTHSSRHGNDDESSDEDETLTRMREAAIPTESILSQASFQKQAAAEAFQNQTLTENAHSRVGNEKKKLKKEKKEKKDKGDKKDKKDKKAKKGDVA